MGDNGERMPYLQGPALGLCFAQSLLQPSNLPVETLHVCFKLLLMQAPVCKEAHEVLPLLRALWDDVKA